MLVLSRRKGESIKISGGITITVLTLSSGRVKVGIDAPPGVVIHRQELIERLAGMGGGRRRAELAAV